MEEIKIEQHSFTGSLDRWLALQHWSLATAVLAGRPSHRALALLPRRYAQFTLLALMDRGGPLGVTLKHACEYSFGPQMLWTNLWTN